MNPLVLAARRLTAIPGFALAAIVSIALGTGANSAVFGAIDGLLRRPLPFPEGDRITWVFARSLLDPADARDKLTTPEAATVARMQGFQAVAVIGDRALVFDSRERPERWHGLWVTRDLFRVLGIAPVLGRPLDDSDLSASAAPAMMISYERWTRDFASDPAIIGRVVAFADAKRFTVVGVLPPELRFPLGRPPHSGNGSGFVTGHQDFWILGQTHPDDWPGGIVIARLADGVSTETVAAEANVAAATVLHDGVARQFELVTVRDQLLGVLAPALPLAQAFAGLVLVIAGANLANLMLLRALALERDAAVRLALGAQPRAVIAPLLCEGVILSTLGSIVGLGLATAAIRWMRQTLAWQPALAESLELNPAILIASIVLAATLTFTCSLVPAALRGRISIRVLLGKNDVRVATPAAARWRSMLVVTQVALALTLIIGAGLLHRSLMRLTAVDLGYEHDRVVAADVLLYVPGREVHAFFSTLVPTLLALPDVDAVGLIHSTPLTGKWTFDSPISRIDGGAATIGTASGNFVAFDYFGAMRIPILSGRAFSEDELRLVNPPIVILNDVAARHLFGDQPAVGQRVHVDGKVRTVIGVVKATRDVTLERVATPQWYLPGVFGGSQVLVRVTRSAEAFVGTLRQQLVDADSRLMISSIGRLETLVAEQTIERRMFRQLLVAFAGIALVLAVAGLWGVTHAVASERRRELAVRVALGARPVDVLRTVLGRTIVLVCTGLGVGLAIASTATGLLSGLLFDTAPNDPSVTLGAACLLLGAAVLASAWPARRATRANPLELLRS